MSRIVFFGIPANGHTNPTIGVVRALTNRGHKVRYYSFDMFRDKIEAVGAQFVSCDAYLPPAPADLERRQQYDFTSLFGMLARLTISMGASVCGELQEFNPNCIVSDSLSIWGKLYARKMSIPMICSTTSFAFNSVTAKLIKPGFRELYYTLTGIFKMDKYIKLLRQHGYEARNITDLIQNDNETDTIVYTSRDFQPSNETFSDKFVFIGPSVPGVLVERIRKERPLIYISSGTVLNNPNFYQSCVKALKDNSFDVIMSVGSEKNVALLQNIPGHFRVKASVPQLELLQNTDVFITHCGMNSVSESIYFEVPMVLMPQHSEQNVVARRAQEVGVGIRPNSGKPKDIKIAVEQILGNKEQYRKNLRIMADSFRSSGGSERAADKIEEVIVRRQITSN